MNPRLIVSFIDVSFILVIMLILVAQQDIQQGKTADRKSIPTIFVFMETKGKNDYQARCNGHLDISPQQVVAIACKDKNHRQVLILASIEGDVPYRFWHYYKQAIDIHNLDLKRLNKKGIILKWDTQLLEN